MFKDHDGLSFIMKDVTAIHQQEQIKVARQIISIVACDRGDGTEFSPLLYIIHYTDAAVML